MLQLLTLRHFRLIEQTPLMPALNPTDTMEAISKMQRLPAGVSIRVSKVGHRGTTRWYEVKAYDKRGRLIAKGWINSIALMGQAKAGAKQRLLRQATHEEKLRERLKAGIAKKHDLTKEQLTQISLEGIKKNWPMTSAQRR